MSMGKVRLCRFLIVTAMGALIGWSVANGNAVVPIPVALAGVGLLSLSRKWVRGVIEDERVCAISGKASWLTIQVFGVIIALAGATLVAVGIGDRTTFAQAGLALLYSACGLAVLYLIFYSYYSRRS